MKRRGGGHQGAQSNSQPKLWSGECVLSSAAWIAEAPSFTLTHAHLTSGLSIVYLSGLARSAAHETLQNLRERLGSGTQTQQQQPWYVYTHREKKKKEKETRHTDQGNLGDTQCARCAVVSGPGKGPIYGPS